MNDWTTIKTIPTLGPGFFMRCHRKLSLCMDRFDDVDSRGHAAGHGQAHAEKVAEVKTDPGKTLAHVEFTRDGKAVLASLCEGKDRQRRADRVRRRKLQGSQAHPDGQAGRQVQPLQQDHALGGHEPLKTCPKKVVRTRDWHRHDMTTRSMLPPLCETGRRASPSQERGALILV
ncbi:MAG: hypothetical protein IPI44_21870 [Sulfuritalea sp.]|nr:hypothetical protein [Sulfuritalea sp.]